MIGGRATPEGTARQAAQRPGYRVLGPTGLTVSIVGFGGYRTGWTDPAHRAALRAALEAGVNLVDTSSNYMWGDSERLVGEVLAEGIVPREEVVVVTKIGYLQGPNLELAQRREAEGRPFPEMVKYADGVWHCISPEFLEDQLARALDRLQLETVDVLLLHNPEYFLSDAAHHQGRTPLEETRAVFYDRLRRAFEYLDDAVRAGHIGSYGVSSNTCVSPADDPEATSVVRMHEVSGGRMTVLQLPYNLLETGALLERNTSDGTALEAATTRGMGVLVNRPLNATAPGHRGLVRLADPPRSGEPSSDEMLRERVDALARAEAELGRAFPDAAGQGPRVAALIDEHWEDSRLSQPWSLLLRGMLVPEARRGLGELVASAGERPGPEQIRQLQAYQDELNGLVGRLQERAGRQDPRLSASIRQAIEPHLPQPLRDESLSRLAMLFVASSPGVTSVLNGMRHPSYVADAVGVMELPPIPDVAAVARAFA